MAASGLTALLPVAAAFAGVSGLGGSAAFGAGPGGTALLPVAPGLRGGALEGAAAPGFASGFALGALGAGVEAFDASAPGAAFSGSAGLGVAEAGAVALGGTTLLPVEPGLAGAALGVALGGADMSEGLFAVAAAAPPAVGPDASGRAAPASGEGFVALGDTALLPLAPGLAGDPLGAADGVFAPDAAGFVALGVMALLPLGPGLAGAELAPAGLSDALADEGAWPGLEVAGLWLALSAGRSLGPLPLSFGPVTGVSSPLDISFFGTGFPAAAMRVPRPKPVRIGRPTLHPLSPFVSQAFVGEPRGTSPKPA